MAPSSKTNNKDKESNSGNTNTKDSSDSQKKTNNNNNHNNSSSNRLTQAQQQYLKDLVKEHVTNNYDPKNKAAPHPLDFEKSDDKFLRKYKDHFDLSLQDNMTLNGFMLNTKLGAKTESWKKIHGNTNSPVRIEKAKLANEVKKHFTSYNLKESECIPTFIYKVRNNGKKFKMEF
ncbi:Sap30p SCDLUD_001245 [Saccharomycodes ludwigii]|uniref:Sap30p n=1 Tax=Saccharomycodes ludwigii TaxID=36035 RepID=UPI001E8B37E0|nr:hypothetical protein SCDLUD_001245 [Saccharomycodes ludwigii]KAH3903601.1 hypothetical protein SCDLUD_001245 [Saccharomycodes ludwigii]